MVGLLTDFMNLTALRKLEMTLGSSDDIRLFPPTQLKELTLSISKVASEPKCVEHVSMYLSQIMHITRVFVSVHMDKSYGFIF